MKVGIDARFLTHPQRGGFKTYTEGLINALAKIDPTNTYILFVDRLPDSRTKLPEASNFNYRVVPGRLQGIGMVWREQISLPFQVARDQIDVLHSPCLTAPLFVKVPQVVTIHDTIWYSPNRFNQAKKKSIHHWMLEKYYQYLPVYTARRAGMVLTDSCSAKQDIMQILGLPEKKITVTYLAASGVFRKVEDAALLEATRQKYKLPENYIFAIGSADPRKNIATLIRAYALLSPELRERYPLLIVWADPALAQALSPQIEELGIKNQVFSRPQASIEEIALFYNLASLFVFPSFYEGFGMTPLEAMACGTPVVTVNNSSIPEVVGDAALMTQAEDAQAISTEITRLLTDDSLRLELIRKGLDRAKTFSWEKCARLTLEAYQQAVNG